MSVLITADLHFSDSPRDYYRHQFVRKELLEVIGDNKVKTLVILGDLTEKKDRHSSWLTNTVAEHLNILGSWVKVIILQGNHDALDVACPFFYFVTMLRGSRQIRWIGDPSLITVEGLGRCLFLPHTTDHRRWVELPMGSVDWIFAHNTFKGTISESGKELDGIPTDVFPKGVRVISGDIHKPQVVGPVTYVGSPYLIDFGDNFDPRMLLIKKSGVVKSIPCTGPQKRLLHVDYVPDAKFVVSGESHAGDVVKVRVPVTKEVYAEWPEIQRKVRAWGESNGVEVHTIQPVVESSKNEHKSNVKKSGNARESDKSLVKRYGRLQGFGGKVIRIGCDLLE